MVSPYPAADEEALDDEAEKQMAVVIEIVRAIRNARAEFRVEPARWIEALVAAAETKPAIETQAQAIDTLARVRPRTLIGTEDARPAVGEGGESGKKAKMVVLEGAEVILPMAGMVDLEAERARLKKESEGNQAEIARIEARLKDQSFLSKAPPNVVEREREKLTALQAKLERL